MNSPLKITFIIPESIDIAGNIQDTSLGGLLTTLDDIKNEMGVDSITSNPHHEFNTPSLYIKKYLENTKKTLQYLTALSVNSPCLSQVSIQSPHYLESVVRIPYICEGQYFKTSMRDFYLGISPKYFNFRKNSEGNVSFLNTKARNLHILIESTRQQCKKIFENHGIENDE